MGLTVTARIAAAADPTDLGTPYRLVAPSVAGIYGSGIIEVAAELFLAGVIATDGTIRAGDHTRLVSDGRATSHVLHDRAIHITQSNIRAVHLAKTALYARCRLLMDNLAVDRIDETRLASAFGGNLDAKYAVTLGMIADCDLDQVSAAGHAARTGAMVALVCSSTRREIEQVVREMHKITLAPRAGLPRALRRGDGHPRNFSHFAV